MARTDAEHLAALKEQRDLLVDQMSAVSAYNVGNRGAKREHLREQYQTIVEEIQRVEAAISDSGSGLPRNFAKLVRRPVG